MDQKNGYWWSPDSKCIAFTEVNSSEIPLYRIIHQGKITTGSDAQEEHVYPFAGGTNVKGGPGIQLVSDSWANTVDMRAQFLRSKGILVWKMDNRGSSRRGYAFEGGIKNNFGRFDADDQVAGVEWLIKQGPAKAGHIGMYWWSYGGYLSAISLSRFPDVFKCAVSGAPVISWDDYDSFYIEKYMGMPCNDPKFVPVKLGLWR